MNAEAGTDLSTGQAVPSLDKRGNDDFTSMLNGDTGGGQSQETRAAETTKVAGTSEKPELVQTTLQKPAGADGTQTQTTQQGGTQAQTQTALQTTAPAGALDKSVLDQIVETATRTASAVARENGVSTAQVKRDQKELTPEEFNAKYQIPEVNEGTIQAILDADPKKGAAMLRQLLMRVTGSSVLMAKDVIDAQMKQVREEMNPHITSWQDFQREQRETKLVNDFYAANADLVNEKPLVKEMQDAIFGRIASGQLKPFNRPEDALKAVADATRAVLTRMGKVTAQGTSQQTHSQSQTSHGQQASSSRQMAAVSTAGQSGTGKAAGKSDEESVFGKDWV